MTNPYDIHETAQVPRPTQPAAVRPGVRRQVLWVLLVLSAAVNAVTSYSGRNLLVGIVCELFFLACIAALVVDHYKHKS